MNEDGAEWVIIIEETNMNRAASVITTTIINIVM